MNASIDRSRSAADGLAGWRLEALAITGLAVPIALTMLSHIAMVTTDVVMMGWLGPEALAAGTLANHYYWLFDMGAMGLLGSLTAILAQHIGARRFRMVRRGRAPGLLGCPDGLRALPGGPVERGRGAGGIGAGCASIRHGPGLPARR